MKQYNIASQILGSCHRRQVRPNSRDCPFIRKRNTKTEIRTIKTLFKKSFQLKPCEYWDMGLRVRRHMIIQDIPTANDAAAEPLGNGIILYLYPRIHMRLMGILMNKVQKSIQIRLRTKPSHPSI